LGVGCGANNVTPSGGKSRPLCEERKRRSAVKEAMVLKEPHSQEVNEYIDSLY
jgi:hypothetical protein